MRRIGTTYLLAFILISAARSQPAGFNHPELVWRTIETEHFFVHYHDGAERTARTVADIAERVYAPITRLYNYEPDGKVHWIIRDHDDYSNGASYYYEQKIEIWAKPLDFEFRGTHHWLYDVITHEFTHMIQLGAARKGPRWLPAFYFQYIDYEPEKRPDVLYGYPNRLISYPFTMTVVPMWFAEGTAQFQEESVHHDWWDSHRDMMLRVRALDDKLLTYSEMGVFGKNSLGSESVYNHGYSLVRYIAGKWGQSAIAELTAALGRPGVWSFDKACRQVLGIGGRELYDQWAKYLKENYRSVTATIRTNPTAGKPIGSKGFANLYPAWSPDGKRLAFLSNEGADYLSLARLRFYDLASGKISDPDAPVRGSFSWSPDGKFIAYARTNRKDRNGSHFSDLFLWEVGTKREIRLTRGARLAAPAFSPDGRRLAAVHNSDGTHNLAIAELPENIPDRGKDITAKVTWRLLTHYARGEQVHNPQWSLDGRLIYAAQAELAGRDILAFDTVTGEAASVIATAADERDISVSSDGGMIYSSDASGIFNLYRFDPSTGKSTPLTNVIGGAFMPAAGPDGSLAYSEFTPDGYRVKLLTKPWELDPELLRYDSEVQDERPNLEPTQMADKIAKPYKPIFNKLFVLPRIAWDYGKFKPGFYAFTGDILDELTLFGGAALGGKGDRDLYLSAEYRVLYPTLFLEMFNIKRHESRSFDDPFVIIGEDWVDSIAVPIFDQYSIDYSFNLSEADIGGRVTLADGWDASAMFRWSNYKSALRFDDGGSFTYTYLRGRSYILRLNGDRITPGVTREIHPRGGWRGWLELARENNRFLDGFKIEAERGTIVEVYNPYSYFRLETDIDYYWKVYQDWVLNPRLGVGWLSESVDPFFHIYAGGLQGLRGYSYYSLGGTRMASLRLSLRFPITGQIDRALGPLYFDRLHGALFSEIGDAWRGDVRNSRFKRDIGGEVRLGMFSWYGFPTDIQFAGAYGLDRFTVTDQSGRHSYGGEWRWYLTVLFGFL